MTSFEVVSSETSEHVARYEVTADDFPFTVQRQNDWVTSVMWALPEEYSYSNFLEVVEEMFKEAEANGYATDGKNSYAMGSSNLERVVEGEFIRPLEPGDFEEFGISDDEIGFLRLGDDLAHFYFSRNRMVGIIIEDRPHQTRSGFGFMANLFPSRLRLEPAEIGQFVLGLQKPH